MWIFGYYKLFARLNILVLLLLLLLLLLIIIIIIIINNNNNNDNGNKYYNNNIIIIIIKYKHLHARMRAVASPSVLTPGAASDAMSTAPTSSPVLLYHIISCDITLCNITLYDIVV